MSYQGSNVTEWIKTIERIERIAQKLEQKLDALTARLDAKESSDREMRKLRETLTNATPETLCP